jgi:hypothetical protein
MDNIMAVIGWVIIYVIIGTVVAIGVGKFIKGGNNLDEESDLCGLDFSASSEPSDCSGYGMPSTSTPIRNTPDNPPAAYS